MSKSKKISVPKIDPRVLARPRLDALFDRHARGELDMDGLQAGVQALIGESGSQVAIDALIKRLENTPEAERETLMTLIPRLRDRVVLDTLWQQVKKPGALSFEAKTTALVILKGMGEDVDLSDPGRYFSTRDLKPADVKSAQNLFRMGLRGMARHLREARDSAEVEAFMARIYQLPQESLDGDSILFELIANAEAEANDLVADFLYALAHTTPDPKVRQAAEQSLARLAKIGVKPVTPAIVGLGHNQLYAAYMTDPDHPWQQSVNVAWEHGDGTLQALVFLLDFGLPWRGAIKDMFATRGMTPYDYQHQFIGKVGMDERMYRVSLARAQATLVAALEANRANKIPLPKEFTQVRHLIDRWVLHPPAAALEADAANDELGARPLVPDRSSRPLMLDLRDLEHNETLLSLIDPSADDRIDDDEEESEDGVSDLTDFEAIVRDVSETHAAMSSDRPWWQDEWVRDYLASLAPDGETLERFDEKFEWILDDWFTLKNFLQYLDDFTYEIHEPGDVHGFHLSDYVQQEADADDDRGRSRVETLRDFFVDLAQHDWLSREAPLLVEMEQMLAQPDEIRLLPRPQPLGGEVAVWLPFYEPDERLEPLTYNEWWLAIMLTEQFDRKWKKFRQATAKQVDAGAKLALIDRLESRLVDAPELLDDFDFERPPTPADTQQARRWWQQAEVNNAQAW